MESVLGASPQEFESLILRRLWPYLPSRAYQSGFVGINDGLKPVAEAELGEYVGDMRFDGGLGQEEPLTDLGV